jgi:ribosomal protein S18 acetylase RimI-like enzyme
MIAIRGYRPEDLADLYRICLATGDAGADAARLYADPDLVGHVYAAPYALFSPETAFVIEDEDGVAGYILGPPDTRAFEAWLEADWWPDLRKRYRDPSDLPREHWTRDQGMCAIIHHPLPAPSRVVERYPAHLHIDLLPRVQARGFGGRMMDTWLGAVRARGAAGAHLAVGAANTRAIGFYRRHGFREMVLASTARTQVHWFVIALD